MTDAPLANNPVPAADASAVDSRMSEDAGSISAPTEMGARTRRWRPPGDWRARLSARTPEGVLGRIVDGDPLGLRRLVGQVIRQERQLADADRVHLRAIACIAHRATAGPEPESARWLEERVREALDGVVAAECAKHDAGQSPEPRSALAVLADPLGLAPMDLRRACSILNRHPFGEREAFFAIVIDGLDLDATAASAGVSSVEFARRARRALDAVIEALGDGDACAGAGVDGAGQEDTQEDTQGNTPSEEDVSQ